MDTIFSEHLKSSSRYKILVPNYVRTRAQAYWYVTLILILILTSPRFLQRLWLSERLWITRRTSIACHRAVVTICQPKKCSYGEHSWRDSGYGCTSEVVVGMARCIFICRNGCKGLVCYNSDRKFCRVLQPIVEDDLSRYAVHLLSSSLWVSRGHTTQQ